MKKSLYVIFSLVALLTLMGCRRPYMTPITVDIPANYTAFLVDLEGNSKEGQAKLDSLDYYEKSKAVAKRVTIAQRWEQTGRQVFEGRWIPIQRVILVDRTPSTRRWYSEIQLDGKGGYTISKGAQADKAGLSTETKSSVGITVGIQLSGRVEEMDTARFLYYYGASALKENAKYTDVVVYGRDLQSVLDNEVYGTTGSLISNYAATYDDSAFIAKKVEWTADLMKRLNETYRPFGITLSSVGGYGGNIFDNPKIQEAIDARLTAEKSLEAARMEVEASRVKMGTIDYRRIDADIRYKNAIAAYVEQAAVNKLTLVPNTLVTEKGEGLILNLKQ